MTSQPAETTEGDAADYGESPEVMPVPVSFPREVLDSGLRTSPQAAGFGAWTTYALAGTEKAQVILPFDDARARALIVVSGTGFVVVGTQAQCQASPVLGGQLPAGAVVEIRNQQSLWMVPNGTAITVSVLMERYETAQGAG